MGVSGGGSWPRPPRGSEFKSEGQMSEGGCNLGNLQGEPQARWGDGLLTSSCLGVVGDGGRGDRHTPVLSALCPRRGGGGGGGGDKVERVKLGTEVNLDGAEFNTRVETLGNVLSGIASVHGHDDVGVECPEPHTESICWWGWDLVAWQLGGSGEEHKV